MAVGKTVDRKGQPLTMKMTGPVEAWFRDTPEPDAAGPDAPS
jgi:hypothetical protein